ncbi:MAG TPA: hypothetical protein VG738_19675 [Chitinophagaceae bacterium]|nr:hypothetical protein [Chitinophagaceae bacterium]
MKKCVWCVLFLCCFALKPKAQSAELQQLLLDIQKLSQFKSILTDMYKGYEVLSSGYETIKNISQGNFSLHQAFLDGLLLVSPAVANYKRIPDIINDQLNIVKEYKSAYTMYKQDKHFLPDEIIYLGQVYGNLFNQSVNDLNELIMVITANQTRMSDAERISSIDRIYAGMEDKLTFLRYFNNHTTMLAVQRAKEQNDAGTLQNIYGITP